MELILQYIIIFYVVTFLWSLLNAVLSILSGLLFGGKVGSFSIFWFECQLENGTYKWKRKKFSALPGTTITGEQIMGDNVQRTKLEVTHMVALIAICEACAVYFLIHFKFASPLGFVGILFGVLGVSCIGEMIFTLYHRFGNSVTARCAREVDEYLKQVMQGRRPRDIALLLEKEVKLPSLSGQYKYQYVVFQYYRALDQRDRGEMKRAISSLEEILPKGKPLHFMAYYYAECVFYYSFVEINQGKAEHYYKQCPALIEKDMDLNGRRIYAYYLYYIKKEPEAALQAVREGLEVAESFSTKGHIPMEKELLHFLQNRITEEQTDRYERGTII